MLRLRFAIVAIGDLLVNNVCSILSAKQLVESTAHSFTRIKVESVLTVIGFNVEVMERKVSFTYHRYWLANRLVLVKVNVKGAQAWVWFTVKLACALERTKMDCVSRCSHPDGL